ncbi:hypothetical protein QE368_001799 [Asaia bogorensis NBRC 16594]|nr:hypothetical protein [Asaia bogorensis NBRC 16594]
MPGKEGWSNHTTYMIEPSRAYQQELLRRRKTTLPARQDLSDLRAQLPAIRFLCL